MSSARMRQFAGVMLASLALMLAGCFMSPGKFTSELRITGPNSFSFSYDGEIFFLGVSKLAQMGAASPGSFVASCFDEQTFESRECTLAEESQQREEWEAGAAGRAAEAMRQAEQMAALMGGIDPSDPEAAEELVRLLQRQQGWERVVHKGEGVFDVSYRTTGTLGHDFMFPMIEGFPPTNPFVQVFLRKGGQVRVNAPGFAAQSDGGVGALFGTGSLASLAALGVDKNGGAQGAEILPDIPTIDGSFTLRAGPGMRILANNTDEGPLFGNSGEALTWTIGARTAQAPTALVATAP